MLDLAIHFGQGPIPLNVIAKRQSISEYYLEQLIASLRRAGLVTSYRGARGGYELAKPPADISIGDIIRTLEGSIAPMECVDDVDSCSQLEKCAMRILWQKLQTSMEQVLEETNLAWLCAEEKKLMEDKVPDTVS